MRYAVELYHTRSSILITILVGLRKSNHERDNLGISVAGEVIEPPVLAPTKKAACLPRMHEQMAWELTWRWPGVNWHVAIDPILGQLVELNDQAQAV